MMELNFGAPFLKVGTWMFNWGITISGQEMRVLDNPHFRSSLAGLMHYTKVLRLFYTTTDRRHMRDSSGGIMSGECTERNTPGMLNMNPPSGGLPVPAIASKVFHVEHCVSHEQVRLGSCHNFNQLPLAAHREVLSRINEWVAHNSEWQKPCHESL